MSRDRKKMEREQLQDKATRLAQANLALTKENQELRRQVSSLMKRGGGGGGGGGGAGGRFRKKSPQHLSVTARNSSSSFSSSNDCDGDIKAKKHNEELDRRCGTNVADDDNDVDDVTGRKVPGGKAKGLRRGEQPSPSPRDPEITHPDRCSEYSAAERREVNF